VLQTGLQRIVKQGKQRVLHTVRSTSQQQLSQRVTTRRQGENVPQPKKRVLLRCGAATEMLCDVMLCDSVAQCALTRPCRNSAAQTSYRTAKPESPNKKFVCAELRSSRRNDRGPDPAQQCCTARVDTGLMRPPSKRQNEKTHKIVDAIVVRCGTSEEMIDQG
jgi:hypothetical protein